MSESTVPALIHDGMTVNEIIRYYPVTIEIFNRFGVDACCGGGVPPHVAAERDGAEPEALWSALQSVAEGRAHGGHPSSAPDGEARPPRGR